MVLIGISWPFGTSKQVKKSLMIMQWGIMLLKTFQNASAEVQNVGGSFQDSKTWRCKGKKSTISF